MHLHCVDFSANPIRVLTGYSERNRIVVTDLQSGPIDKQDEIKWLSDWLKKNRRRFMSPKLHIILDPENTQTKLKPSEKLNRATSSQKKSNHDPERHQSQAKNVREAREHASLYRSVCQLPQIKGHNFFMNLQSEINITYRDSILSRLENAYGSCQKLSILSLALWSSVLLSYPAQLNMTIAVAWITQGITSVIIIEKGILIFYRQFPKAPQSPELWAQSVKICIEQFSFLYPWSSIDMILLGGSLDHAENMKAWIEGDSNCPCDFIFPSAGSRIKLEKNAIDVSQLELIPYWPAMGLLYETGFPWHTLYTPYASREKKVAA